jgi:hypothetical protein
MYSFISIRGQAEKGQTPFRESFAKLGELRSLVKAGKYKTINFFHVQSSMFSTLSVNSPQLLKSVA